VSFELPQLRKNYVERGWFIIHKKTPMMRIIHAILKSRLNAVIIRNGIKKCALKWHVDRFGTSLMKAARENAQIKH